MEVHFVANKLEVLCPGCADAIVIAQVPTPDGATVSYCPACVLGGRPTHCGMEAWYVRQMADYVAELATLFAPAI